jgi:hypothetical protein
MTSLLRRLIQKPIDRLVDAACLLAIAALALFALSILFPRPLLIIAAMSLGHLLGALALANYLLAVVATMARRDRR